MKIEFQSAEFFILFALVCVAVKETYFGVSRVLLRLIRATFTYFLIQYKIRKDYKKDLAILGFDPNYDIEVHKDIIRRKYDKYRNELDSYYRNEIDKEPKQPRVPEPKSFQDCFNRI